MIRVLHISKYYYPFSGGTELVARQCVRALQEAESIRFEQAVFCFDHKGMKGSSSGERSEDSVDQVDGVRVVRCKCEAKVASQSLSFSYRRRLQAVFQQFEPDIVVLHYPNPFATHYLLSFLKPDQKLVIFWHLDIVKQKTLGKLFYGQNRRLLERADRLIAASPNYREGSPWLRQYREKVVVIPDCMDDAGFESEDAGSDNEGIRRMEDALLDRYSGRILCLAVGRHVEYKGFRYLIEAASYLDDRFVIVITGAGPLTEELKNQAEQLRQQNSGIPEIIFAGLVPDVELQAYLHVCDIFCFPSITKNEAFGIAMVEAMYCGKPAVTFTIEGSGVNYVSLGGVTGIECPNCDSQAYAEAIRLLADRPELRKQYGEAARKRVQENFLYKQFAEHIQKLFAELT